MSRALILVLGLALLGCERETLDAPSSAPPASEPEINPQPAVPHTEPASVRLDAILAAMPEAHQARHAQRNPKQTLAFFGIEPGMTVVEILPGGGWYSQILLPYLGEEGRLIGVNYEQAIWPKLGFFDDEAIAQMQTWVMDWPEQAQAWRGEAGASVEAFEFGALPESMAGSADAVLMIRALHNLARFENDGGFLTTALNDVHRVLKPGGIVGIVQHEARPDMPDAWAGGGAGYLKKQFVIDRMASAGFEYIDQSDINENANDEPGTGDVVWRLPPSYGSSGEDQTLRAKMDAIGESNRMTLEFRKPGE